MILSCVPCLLLVNASQLVRWLEKMKQQEKLKIRCVDLIGRSTTAPLSDKLSCLAALPPQAWSIVPEPYRALVEPSRSKKFEDIYDSCFHQETNAFDITSFQEKCNDELSKIRTSKAAKVKPSDQGKQKSKDRRIYAGGKFWTCLARVRVPLSHPFDPPEPFTERVPRLRRNKKIRATKLPVKTWIENPNKMAAVKSEKRGDNQSTQSVHEIPYKKAFKNHNCK